MSYWFKKKKKKRAEQLDKKQKNAKFVFWLHSIYERQLIYHNSL